MARNGSREEFQKIFIQELKNIYQTEKTIIEKMPFFINSVSSDELKKELKNHFEETKKQQERLENVFSQLNEQPTGGSCEAIEGLLNECSSWINQKNQSIVNDAALIGALQKIEHYEIASYGTLKAFAIHLELSQIEKVLDSILREEKNENQKLTQVAEGGIFTSGLNVKASH